MFAIDWEGIFLIGGGLNMKIGELLELTQVEPLAKIAKERLTIGEKSARQALKAAGCYSISGKRGWYCDDSNVLEKSIYDFAPPRKIERKATANVRMNQRNNEGTKEPTNQPFNVATKEQTLEPSNVVEKEINKAKAEVATTLEGKKERTKERSNVNSNVVRKRASFDLDVELLKELKIQAVIHDRNVYEIVETAIKQYLAELKK